MPYRIRDDAYIDIRAVFAVAKRAISAIRITPLLPRELATIFVNGASEPATCSHGTIETAQRATRI
jgi:hypothetical protein